VIPLSTNDNARNGSSSSSGKGRPAPTPWRRMMSSPAVWAIVINNFSFHYAFYVIMNWLPTYFNR
jgi:ACS family sodium-dependent inorganic phosphate cotransporter